MISAIESFTEYIGAVDHSADGHKNHGEVAYLVNESHLKSPSHDYYRKEVNVDYYFDNLHYLYFLLSQDTH
jgi:hypothetical protein